MKKSILFISFVFVFSGISAVSAKADEASHIKAVKELFKLIEMEKVTDLTLQSSAEVMAAQTDHPDQARPKIEKFLHETVGFPIIEDEMIRMYRKHFSEAEVQDLIRFYKTPTGQKMAKAQQQLFREGSAIGQGRMSAKSVELQKLMNSFKN